MLDASGQVSSGFVWGNNYWMGSKKECQRVNEPTHIVLSDDLPKNHLKNLTEIGSPFPVEYKLTWARHQSQWQLDINTFDKVSFHFFSIFFFSLEICHLKTMFMFYFCFICNQTIIHLGLCLPATCGNDDVENIVEVMLNDHSFGKRYFFDDPIKVIQTKSLKLREDYFSTPIVYTFL